jgi:anti-sigma factor RsiW
MADGDTRGARVLPMRPRGARPAWTAVARWMPRSAAAAVLLAVAGIVAAGALAPRGGVLAAQLALDHLKCLVIAHAEPHVEAADVEQQWQAARGWAIKVPPSSAAHGLRLVGLRTCLFHEGQMAHVLYEHAGHRVSLFVMPQHESPETALAVFGQQTRTWSHDGRTYALVAAGSAGTLGDVEGYLRAQAR